MHISDNKHEYNVREVERLSKDLKELEKQLLEVEGFFKRCKVKKAMRKINRQINTHSDEIFIYEKGKQNK